MVTTPPNLDLVGAGPVGSHHGSYRCVRYRGGQIWGGTWGSARAASMVMATATSPRSHSVTEIDMLNGPNALISAPRLGADTADIAALASAATPPWRMRATSPGHDHGTRPAAAHRRLPSGHPPTTFRLVEISPHLATCHHPLWALLTDSTTQHGTYGAPFVAQNHTTRIDTTHGGYQPAARPPPFDLAAFRSTLPTQPHHHHPQWRHKPTECAFNTQETRASQSGSVI